METLVVVSKVKARVKKEDFNTSAEVPDALTEHIEKILAGAVQSARADGRKTVMRRDVEGALNGFKVGDL